MFAEPMEEAATRVQRPVSFGCKFSVPRRIRAGGIGASWVSSLALPNCTFRRLALLRQLARGDRRGIDRDQDPSRGIAIACRLTTAPTVIMAIPSQRGSSTRLVGLG